MSKAILIGALMCSAASAEIQWGLNKQGDISITVLKQLQVPSSVPVAEPRPTRPSEGVMVNVSSPDLAGDTRAKVTVFVGVVLESGKYVFQERVIDYDRRFPTTLFFPVGPVAAVIRLRADITKTADIGE